MGGSAWRACERRWARRRRDRLGRDSIRGFGSGSVATRSRVGYDVVAGGRRRRDSGMRLELTRARWRGGAGRAQLRQAGVGELRGRGRARAGDVRLVGGVEGEEGAGL
eukprot:1196314-Prorocentrum_minimum.AAC.6